MTPSLSGEPVLALSDVHLHFPYGADWRGRPKGVVHALNGISLSIRRGETLGIVGESGCGKSSLAQILLGIRRPTTGSLDLRGLGEGGLQIVFQDPQSSLNPRMRVWELIVEPVFARKRLAKAALRQLAQALAEKVGLRPETLNRYPHEFSGGQRQRIAIARALSSDPDLIVLDEPTSALDISVQAQIINLLKDLQAERGLSYVFISHDMSVIRHMCDRIAVMYLGQVVEIGATAEVLARPSHPYTRLLMESVPSMFSDDGLGAPLTETELPSNRRLPSGCFFRNRCAAAREGCDLPQALAPMAGDAEHAIRCHVFR
ncbi:oligopeptide/dipeptide ABC transporter ATP-binding protein [Rhizobium sp. SG2393]|uniref:oligopeptide/dipeptide ABC transporter ATP-binding protein n=1 Tax=Rhizobium sp. SG2393 TaxID=3276279 RepID=UPI00366F4793